MAKNREKRDFSCDRCFERKNKGCIYKSRRTDSFCEGFHITSGESTKPNSKIKFKRELEKIVGEMYDR